METPIEVDVVTASRLFGEGALLLDVREPSEVAAASVSGSQTTPMRQIPETLTSLPQDRTILVLCHSGGRSLRVTQYLRANGFDKVSNVAGGIVAWAEQVDPSLAP
jgi:rhodanese-related sulfurtransferase